ncbi:MAG: phosphoglucosamine mutase [Chlorobium sp.]|uniref:phosphoglucosamine mutase n=1 Tax=Chlorobium sp. TaxID=1095 RepID=UPI0025C13CA7|nr:phosphoglucosamine mutase [Chlorobium sp.]MCF8382580.1 phosphoglucosamine mutase [Chlorobium sp.]
MSLMISVSGIRGVVGESLTPKNLTAFTSAFATWIQRSKKMRNPEDGNARPRIVIGRDTRPTGKQIAGLVSNVLALGGCDVIDIGIATTPTVEMATAAENADGGLIITASHNPVEWNALKMLNHQGEFLSAEEVESLLTIFAEEAFPSAPWNGIGNVSFSEGYDRHHIDTILEMPFIDPVAISGENYRVLVDCVEGAGYSIVPELCRRLGIGNLTLTACGGTGLFPRNPEPVEENLVGTIDLMRRSGCDFGLIVDPDVDRLAVICEDGSLFGEEYSLVACADFYLGINRGPVVNNLSSSRALADIALRHGVPCYSAKVGEANVTAMMKEMGATIGGEGNGGIILPELHYGRDALAGIALFVQAFTGWRKKNRGGGLREYRRQFPEYAMAKEKIRLGSLDAETLDTMFREIAAEYPEATISRLDGLKLDFRKSWAHLRPSNTEPIVRIYTEAPTKKEAEMLATEMMGRIEKKSIAPGSIS